MDKEVVSSSLQERVGLKVLKELGLLAKGNLLPLRASRLKIKIANERSEKNKNRLRELNYTIRNNDRVSKVGGNKFSNIARTVQLVRKYFNSAGKYYTLVKPRYGRGARSLKINENATKRNTSRKYETVVLYLKKMDSYSISDLSLQPSQRK